MDQQEPQEGRPLAARMVKRSEPRPSEFQSRIGLHQWDLIITCEAAEPSIGEVVAEGSRG